MQGIEKQIPLISFEKWFKWGLLKKEKKKKGLSGQNLKYKDFYWNDFKKPTALVALFDPKSQTTNLTNLHPLGKITPLHMGPNLFNVSDDKHLSIVVYRVLCC